MTLHPALAFGLAPARALGQVLRVPKKTGGGRVNITTTITGAAEAHALLDALGPSARAATRLWANSVGGHMHRATQGALGQRFHLRGTSAQFQRAIVFQKARTALTGDTTREIQAVLKVGSDGVRGTATANLGRLLAKHEEADTRTSDMAFRTSTGRNFVAGFYLPANGLRTNAKNPPRSLYPTAIGAQMRIDAGGRLTYAKGTRKGTKGKRGESFFATEKGIFRRRHSGFGEAKPEAIWWFSRRIRTPARLELWTTAQLVFDRFSMQYADDAIDLVTARTG